MDIANRQTLNIFLRFSGVIRPMREKKEKKKNVLKRTKEKSQVELVRARLPPAWQRAEPAGLRAAQLLRGGP